MVHEFEGPVTFYVSGFSIVCCSIILIPWPGIWSFLPGSVSQNCVCSIWPPGLFTQQLDAAEAAVEQLSIDFAHVSLFLKMWAPVSAPTRGSAMNGARRARVETAILTFTGELLLSLILENSMGNHDGRRPLIKYGLAVALHQRCPQARTHLYRRTTSRVQLRCDLPIVV